jgi:hypothetical protein
MRRTTLVLALIPLAACNFGKGSIDDDDDDGVDIGDADDVADLCDEAEPETITLTVEFPAPEPGCDWGEDGNLDPENAFVRARREQVDSLELPENAVICDVVFDFAGINGGQGTPMVYDDNFFFLFNGVVLASSYQPLVEEFPLEDDLYYLYDWDSIVDRPFEFDNDIPTYCLGEDDGLASCDIPPPETNGIMSLSFESSVVNELAFRAIEAGAYDFTFVTVGDNDDTDCYHEDFAFDVEIPYVTY